MVERNAPGFRSLVRVRAVQGPGELQAMDANLVQGAINAGTAAMYQQLFFRPVPGLGARTPPSTGSSWPVPPPTRAARCTVPRGRTPRGRRWRPTAATPSSDVGGGEPASLLLQPRPLIAGPSSSSSGRRGVVGEGDLLARGVEESQRRARESHRSERLVFDVEHETLAVHLLPRIHLVERAHAAAGSRAPRAGEQRLDAPVGERGLDRRGQGSRFSTRSPFVAKRASAGSSPIPAHRSRHSPSLPTAICTAPSAQRKRP